jgi:hypothetical protein
LYEISSTCVFNELVSDEYDEESKPLEFEELFKLLLAELELPRETSELLELELESELPPKNPPKKPPPSVELACCCAFELGSELEEIEDKAGFMFEELVVFLFK